MKIQNNNYNPQFNGLLSAKKYITNQNSISKISKYVHLSNSGMSSNVKRAKKSVVIEIIENLINRKEILFARNFKKDVMGGKEFVSSLLTGILSSKNKKEYIRNINDYKSYIRLNKNNEKAIEELDKKLSEGSYDKAVYDKEWGLKSLSNNPRIDSLISRDDLSNYYSNEGKIFIRRLINQYNIPSDISNGAKKDISEIYRTCSAENIDIRQDFLHDFQSKIFYSDNFNEEIHAMRSVFEKMDSNKSINKLVSKFLSESDCIYSIKSLDDILNVIQPDKSIIFFKNLCRLIKITKPGEERNHALQQELTNPFFETSISKHQKRLREDAVRYGFAKDTGLFDIFYTKLENAFNKFRYFIKTKETKAVQSSVAKISQETLQQKAPESHTIKIADNLVLTKSQKNKIKLQEETKEYIRKHLHKNIVARQEKIYAERATKMRLKMLSEILESIKDTRAAERASGRKHPKISNEDAVSLYMRLNGRNKKLINYMLKKRNADGTRMFNINDIIDEIGKVHKRIILENLKPAEAKALYEDAYQEKINSLGKLTGKKK